MSNEAPPRGYGLALQALKRTSCGGATPEQIATGTLLGLPWTQDEWRDALLYHAALMHLNLRLYDAGRFALIEQGDEAAWQRKRALIKRVEAAIRKELDAIIEEVGPPSELDALVLERQEAKRARPPKQYEYLYPEEPGPTEPSRVYVHVTPDGSPGIKRRLVSWELVAVVLDFEIVLCADLEDAVRHVQSPEAQKARAAAEEARAQAVAEVAKYIKPSDKDQKPGASE